MNKNDSNLLNYVPNGTSIIHMKMQTFVIHDICIHKLLQKHIYQYKICYLWNINNSHEYANLCSS